MKGMRKVIYWHRFGLKIFSVGENLVPKLEKEIESKNPAEIEAVLKVWSGKSVMLLLADPMCYLFEKVVEPPLIVDAKFKDKLLNLIKADIPEDFAHFVWDYKVEKNAEGKQRVLVFAPIKEYQGVINTVVQKLSIKIEVMETESVSASRDPNPVVGIVKKTDVKGKDEDVLNISLAPTKEYKKLPVGKMVLGILVMVIIGLLIWYGTRPKPAKKLPEAKPSPTSVETVTSPTPTAGVAVKDWSELKVQVLNGTTRSGLATKTAKIFTDSGITKVDSGNADNNAYTTNKLIFNDEQLKMAYTEKFKSLITVADDDITVDKTISNDVIFILGNN